MVKFHIQRDGYSIFDFVVLVSEHTRLSTSISPRKIEKPFLLCNFLPAATFSYPSLVPRNSNSEATIPILQHPATSLRTTFHISFSSPASFLIMKSATHFPVTTTPPFTYHKKRGLRCTIRVLRRVAQGRACRRSGAEKTRSLPPYDASEAARSELAIASWT
jgi:hypothetical protein